MFAKKNTRTSYLIYHLRNPAFILDRHDNQLAPILVASVLEIFAVQEELVVDQVVQVGCDELEPFATRALAADQSGCRIDLWFD